MCIIIRPKQFIEKHKLMDNVKSLAEEMKVEIEDFYKKFKPLFDKGLPTFWYNNDSLFSKDDYDNLLAQQRVNHDKFRDIEGTLKGEDILNKLENDFNILCQIKQFLQSGIDEREHVHILTHNSILALVFFPGLRKIIILHATRQADKFLCH